MSQKQNETFRQPKTEESLGIVVSQDNFENKIQMYWGPNQNTESVYVGPGLINFDPFTLLSIPLVGRFNYNSRSIDTDDYCPPTTPPPPTGTQQSLWMLCWSYKIRPAGPGCWLWRVAWIHYRHKSPGGPDPPCLPFGQENYPGGIPPLDNTGAPVERYIYNCQVTDPLVCGCHPDCNVGQNVHVGQGDNPNPCNAQQGQFGYGCPPDGGAGRCP